jgi:lysophospholipase L1-like esterase
MRGANIKAQTYSLVIFITKAIVLAWMICAMGCTAKISSDLPPPNGDTGRNTKPKKWLALGDSYTIGQGVTPDERFPHQAAAMLGMQGKIFATPHYTAATGWTTGSLLYALESNPPMGTFDVVSLLIGVNNQYQGRSASEYAIQFGQSLQKALSLAGGKKERVVVLSIPDYSVTPFARRLDTSRISSEIDLFNSINKRLADSAGVAWFDITTGSRLVATDKSLLCPDSLHYSG